MPLAGHLAHLPVVRHLASCPLTGRLCPLTEHSATVGVVSSLGQLIDDAALFPPGNAPMPVAVAAHRYYQGEPWAVLLGPFLCPVGRVEELRAELVPGTGSRSG